MDYKLLLIEIFAIAASYLIITMPAAYATNVNIIFDGNVQDTVKISSGTSVNKQINIQHDPSDRSWTKVKVLVKVNSASLAHNIERVYVYKCRALSPKDCARSTPVDSETYVDTELAWNDISARKGLSPWPEAANIMILVKLTDINNKISWVGFWDTIERIDYNVFNIYSSELSNVDLYAESSDLINPIKSFIENYQMLPFNWATKVVFKTAGSLYGLGASETNLDQSPPQFQIAEISRNEVTVIGNEYQFIFPNTTNGVRNPITLNLNPSFTCGDNIHESDLGETPNNCCYDAGCAAGEYCDIADVSDPSSGTCKNIGSVSLEILPISVPTITACTNQFSIDIKAKVNNPPGGLASTATGYITIGGTTHTASCTGEGNLYTCPVTFTPLASCGKDSYSMGPNTINLTVTFNDGQQTVTRDLGKGFGDIVISYDCSCQSGMYCDISDLACRSDTVSLSILDVRSHITDYAGGTDYISVTAKIQNPPSGMSISSMTYMLGNITFDHSSVSGMSGTITCSAGENNVYACSIPFSISEYDHTKQYVIRDNTLTFSISYPDGSDGNIKTKDITSAFSDITIPSYRCGDGIVNPEETSENCCADIGCTSEGDYCDIVSGCQAESSVTLSIVSLSSERFTDCDEFHTLDIKAKINNMPTDANIVYYAYLLDGEIQSWQLACEQPSQVTGIFNCPLVIPPIEGCSLPYYILGSNQLTVTASFNDGSEQSPFFSQKVKDITTSFDNIQIIPTYHCGDGACETAFGESASNCCIDCSCKDSPYYGSNYYCDYDPKYSSSNGTCLEKSDIDLIIDSQAPTHFSNCEIDSKMFIEARIKNQPSGIIAENVYGTLGGENAERIYCRQEQVQGAGNYTYNCTMTIPSIWDCTQNEHYEYADNSISFFISYYDGLGRRTTQTISETLDDVTIDQGFRTIYDIMEATRVELDAEFGEIGKILDKMVDYAERCIKWLIAAIIAQITLTIVGGMYGGGVFGETEMNIAEGAKTGATIGASMVLSIKLLCDTLQKYKNVQWRLHDIKIKEIMMQQCIEMHQHNIDNDYCRGRELSCYLEIKGCLDRHMGDINSEVNSIQKEMDSLTDDAIRINNEIIKNIERVEDVFEDGHPTLSVGCSNSYRGDDKCCGMTLDGTNYIRSTLYVEVEGQRCEEGKWFYEIDDIYKGRRQRALVADEVFKVIRDNGGNFEGKHTIKLYCGDEQDFRFVDDTNIYYCRGSFSGQEPWADENRICRPESGSALWQCAEEWEGSPTPVQSQASQQQTEQEEGNDLSEQEEGNGLSLKCSDYNSCSECAGSSVNCGWCVRASGGGYCEEGPIVQGICSGTVRWNQGDCT